MTVVEASTVVDAAPAEVWTVVADPKNLPRWDPRISKVEGVPPEGLYEGCVYLAEVKLFGVRATVPAKVVALQPQRYAKVKLGGMVNATIETWLQPVGKKRTKLRHRVDYRFRGGFIGDFGARAVKALGAGSLVERGLRAQKRQAERLAAAAA